MRRKKLRGRGDKEVGTKWSKKEGRRNERGRRGKGNGRKDRR